MKMYDNPDFDPEESSLYALKNDSFKLDPALSRLEFDIILYSYAGVPHDKSFQFEVPSKLLYKVSDLRGKEERHQVYQELLSEHIPKIDPGLILSKRNNYLYTVGRQNGEILFSNHFPVKKGVDISYFLEMIYDQYPLLKNHTVITGDFEYDNRLRQALLTTYSSIHLLSDRFASYDVEARPYLPEILSFDANY